MFPPRSIFLLQAGREAQHFVVGAHRENTTAAKATAWARGRLSFTVQMLPL